MSRESAPLKSGTLFIELENRESKDDLGGHKNRMLRAFTNAAAIYLTI